MGEIAKKPQTLAEAAEAVGQLVMSEISKKQNNGLVFPQGYNVQNAITSAMFQIKNTVDKDKKPALAVCKTDSIKQALWDMASKGLDPDKKHVYWIIYGDTLTAFESYFGLMFRAKRADKNIKDIFAEVVYEKDTFKYVLRHGTKVVTEHLQAPENVDLTKIKGAYCTILYKDGTEKSEYMTMQQIRNSWSRGQTKGESSAHKLSPEQMAKRTVLNRLCKITVNTETNDLLLGNEQFGEEFDEEANQNEATEMIDVTPEPEPEEEVKTVSATATVKEVKGTPTQQQLPFDE